MRSEPGGGQARNIGDLAFAQAAAAIFADDCSILFDHDAIRIDMHIDWSPKHLRHARVLVRLEMHETRLRDRDRRCMEAFEWAAFWEHGQALDFEQLDDCPLLQFGLSLRVGVGNAAVEKSGVEVLIGLDLEARCK